MCASELVINRILNCTLKILDVMVRRTARMEQMSRLVIFVPSVSVAPDSSSVMMGKAVFLLRSCVMDRMTAKMCELNICIALTHSESS